MIGMKSIIKKIIKFLQSAVQNKADEYLIIKALNVLMYKILIFEF